MSITKRDSRGKVLEAVLTEAERNKMHNARWGQRTERLNAATKDELYELYWVESLSTQQIAGLYGVMKNETVMKRLRHFGIPMRTRSEACRIRWATSPELRARIGQASGLSRTGKPIAEENLVRRAITRQARPKPSECERALAKQLHDMDIQAVLWYAFGRYTIDIAVPENKIAIEIGNECHRCKLVIERDNLKKQLLEEAGWQVIYIAIPHVRYNAPDAAQIIAAAIQERAI